MSELGARTGDDLEAALAVGFGATAPPILSALERQSGIHVPRVSLRETGGEFSHPLTRASADTDGLKLLGRGNYQLLGEIARGGMGVLLKGHDLDLGREVALKVLREDLAARPEIVQRFVEEAQIGGQLQHPGIVPVYELGLLADGRPFFAMKLIKGRTLAAVLAERDRTTRRKLFDVFAAVCQTLAYAHARGVVHRDLKPSNVLIGAFGEVQVIDWGLAKVLATGGVDDEQRSRAARTISVIETVRSAALGAGSHSLTGSVMGTPAYMPPEQARGEIERIDQRSDVFALGAILCEILTGDPPYTGESERTVLQAARAELDDARARLARSDADAELVDLCRECLAPEQSQRPRSAEVVSERVQRYLASLEQRARSAEVGAAEARVRARSTVLLTIVAASTLLIGIALWFWWRAERVQRQRVADDGVAAALVEAGAARGQRDWPAATLALERARARLSNADVGLAMHGQVEALAREIEHEARTAAEQALRSQDNARLLAELESIRQPEGDSVYPTDWSAVDRSYAAVFGLHGLALDLEERAVTTALAERGLPVELAASIDAWSVVRRHALDVPGAARLTRIATALDPDSLRTEVRLALAADDRARLDEIALRPEVERLPPITLRLVAHALLFGSTNARAIELLSLARRRFPGDFHIAFELARALRQARPPRARDALAMYEAALALRPGNIEVWHELGMTLSSYLDRGAEAEALFREVVARVPEDGHMYFHLGTALMQTGRDAQAVEPLQRSIELEPLYVLAHENLGISLDRLGRRDEALASYDRALALNPTRATVHHNRATTLRALGRYDEAKSEFERALELDPKFARPHTELAYLSLRTGDHARALAESDAAIALDPKFAFDHQQRGSALASLGRFAEARPAYLESVRLSPNFPNPRRSLAILILRDPASTKADAQAAVEHARKFLELAPDDPDAADLLGVLLYAAGDFEAARAHFSGMSTSNNDQSRKLFLALCDEHLGEAARARTALRELDLEEFVAAEPLLGRFVDEARALLSAK